MYTEQELKIENKLRQYADTLDPQYLDQLVEEDKDRYTEYHIGYVPKAGLILTREERAAIIASVMSGLGKAHIFERDAVKYRVTECLNIASEVLGESLRGT